MGNLKKVCPLCNAVGTVSVPYITGRDENDDNIINRVDETCPTCAGAGYIDYGNSQTIDDILDKVNDVLDKCNDIFEKVSE